MKVSIITPTYNESKNLPVLAERIFSSCKSFDVELIVVDDNSPDGTGEVAEKLAKKYPIKVVHREGKLGLSSAVMEGFKVADGDVIGVIDADLSHPPEKIPELVSELKGDVNFVLASRLVPGGRVEEWPIIRRLVSKGATLIAKPLVKVKDPMSGFFFFRRNVIEGVKLNPIGYKIGLEILVKGKIREVKEVPYTFYNRTVGQSKLGAREQINYLLHVARLYWWKLKHLKTSKRQARIKKLIKKLINKKLLK